MSKYQLIPEWAPHDACWMAWPVTGQVYGHLVEDARKAYAQVANAISNFETVRMIATGDEIAQVRSLCSSSVEIVDLPHSDSWTRDTGPLFVADGSELVAIDFRFNGWGQGIDPGEDVHLAQRIAEHQNLRVRSLDLVMEGGGLHHDGKGALYSTASVVFDENRNPGLPSNRPPDAIMHNISARFFLTAGRGLVDDETNGHIDNLLTFAGEDTVLVQLPRNKRDANRPVCESLIEMLEEACLMRQRPYDIIKLPMPEPMKRHDGSRLTASYTNLYIANDAIIVPRFGADTDDKAHGMIREAFPDRKFVAIDALPILQGGGGIHCITLQQPRA